MKPWKYMKAKQFLQGLLLGVSLWLLPIRPYRERSTVILKCIQRMQLHFHAIVWKVVAFNNSNISLVYQIQTPSGTSQTVQIRRIVSVWIQYNSTSYDLGSVENPRMKFSICSICLDWLKWCNLQSCWQHQHYQLIWSRLFPIHDFQCWSVRKHLFFKK